MSDTQKTLAEYNAEVFVAKGLGQWRALYIEFISKLAVESAVEIGAGTPDFLNAINCRNKAALEASGERAGEFKKAGIDFYQLDLDHAALPEIGPFDLAVCSDVFEHLLFPDRALQYLAKIVKQDGILFSHVPNEFVFKKTIKVMLGRSESLYFHHHCEEFSDPHLHRFTKTGFEKFLSRAFRYNLFISDMRYGRTARVIKALGLNVPYAVEGGPTFISTNSEQSFNLLSRIKRELPKKKR